MMATKQRAHLTMNLDTHDAYSILAILLRGLHKRWNPADWPQYPWDNQRLEDLCAELGVLDEFVRAMALSTLAAELEQRDRERAAQAASTQP